MKEADKNSSLEVIKKDVHKYLNIEQTVSNLALRFIDIHPNETDNVIQQALKEITDLIKTDRTYIYLFEEERKHLVRSHHYNRDGVKDKIRRHEQVDEDDFAWLVSDLFDQKSIYIHDAKKLPTKANTIRVLMEVEEVKSALICPLHYKGTVLGFIGVDAVKDRQEFDASNEYLLTKGASIFAAALHYKYKAHSDVVLEQKFRNLFAEIEDVVFISSPEGKFLEINAAGAILFGYDSVDEIKEIDINRDLYLNTKDRDEFQKALKIRGHVKNYELVLKRKDGNKVTVIETATVVRSERGDIIAYQGILHDITQKRHLEQQLTQAQKLESIGLLAGGVAHDFNNILTTINGYAELMRMEMDQSNPQYETLSNIIDGGKRAEELIRNLLAFSRKQLIEPRVVDINAVINNLHSMLSRLIGEDIRLELRLKDGLQEIKADITQIQQVLVNLVVNSSHAIKARKDKSKKGLIRILTAQCKFSDDLNAPNTPLDKNCIRITIEDNGIGMDDETKEKIFEPFFSTKKEGLGTGLGLSTVYGIVKQNNSHIKVESEPNIGTLFEIYWPVTDEKIVQETKMETEITFKPSGETILFVEDDFHVRDLVAHALKSIGYKIIEAENGEEALDKVVSNELLDKIDLLISDIVMPEMGGEELAENIHNLNPKIKIILCSGYTESHILEGEKFTRNGYHFLPKPFSIKQLEKTIRAVLS